MKKALLAVLLLQSMVVKDKEKRCSKDRKRSEKRQHS